MKTELERKEILRLSNEESNKITRDCLRIAMFKLMDREDYEKISVTELTKLAGVSRVAFYRNYETKEVLVQDICHQLFVELKKSIGGELYRTDRKQWFIDFFTTIKNNGDYFKIYLKANLRISDGLILESIFPTETPEDHYCQAAKEGAFIQILTDWFTSGMKESPEDMGEICNRILGEMGGRSH